jgi:hypothetical protein
MSQEHEMKLDDSEEEIARVREARHRISERFGHDPYRLVNYYIEKQKAHQDRLVRASEPGRVDKPDH